MSTSERLPAECEAIAAQAPSRLLRPFRVIAFDWDGTAVMSRREDATPVRQVLERLLRLDVYVMVITGTNFPNINRQLSAVIQGPHKRNLYISTNRGSEVYGFDVFSHPVLLWRRVATVEENRLLTEVADAVRDAIAGRTGLEVRVIYNRLNRRKIDLVPLPEWSEPPKSALGQLLEVVQARLKGAGLALGLQEALQLAERIAREKGLKDARITSDVKHIEIGLTDKSDAIEWLMRELVEPMGATVDDILIAGDEFGPIAGFEGSDARMITPRARGATFVSVGPEPGGVPPAVVHLGGGAARFRMLLECQAALHEQARAGTQRGRAGADPVDLLAIPASSPDWLLVEEGFNVAREHEMESLFTVSNGYLGTRGSLPEGSIHPFPATFVAGVFDSTPQSGSIPELVIAPDWTRLQIVVEGQELRLEHGEALEHRRVLDMRKGLLWREWHHRDPSGRTTRLRFLRLASLADRHVLLQSVTISPENYSGHIHVEGRVEGPVAGNVASGAGPEMAPASPALPSEESAAPPTGPVVLAMRTRTTGVTVALSVWSQLRTGRGEPIQREVEVGDGSCTERWDWEAEIGETYRLDRLVVVYTSRDVDRPADRAMEHIRRLAAEGVDRVVEAHVQAWEARWQDAEVVVEGDEDAERALRFAIYHLISAANPEDERTSIGARGLTGEAYKGHVFWDTEVYMLPFYVYTHPPSARALLMYRYHTLPAARRRAAAMGYRGALYPWESTDNGEDVTPSYVVAPDGEVVPIYTGQLAHHISADIAYAVWQYWQATGDDDFFLKAGAEIVLETARFWASRGQLEEGVYHIRRVVGPDEYHEGVDDNAYTNVMAQWNLERGVETVHLLQERWPHRWQELAERIGVSNLEAMEWAKLAEAMYTGLDPRTGLFEQFRGYFDLEEIDLAAYEPRMVPMDVLLGRERIRRSKVVKQADVVLLIYLLWDRFPAWVREANFRYYEPRTGHGSSLSPCIYALVAARLGDLALAEWYIRQAAEIDLANNMGNAAVGVHLGAQGGLWQAMVMGFAGMRPGPAGPSFEPHLLPMWRSVQFPVQWRGRRLRVLVSNGEIRTATEG